MLRKHLIIHGTVQGVGFRFRAQYAASRFNITGWAQNLYDGSVEMEVQGEPESIRQMLEQIRYGHFIRIEHIEEKDIPVVLENSFTIRY